MHSLASQSVYGNQNVRKSKQMFITEIYVRARCASESQVVRSDWMPYFCIISTNFILFEHRTSNIGLHPNCRSEIKERTFKHICNQNENNIKINCIDNDTTSVTLLRIKADVNQFNIAWIVQNNNTFVHGIWSIGWTVSHLSLVFSQFIWLWLVEWLVGSSSSFQSTCAIYIWMHRTQHTEDDRCEIIQFSSTPYGSSHRICQRVRLNIIFKTFIL